MHAPQQRRRIEHHQLDLGRLPADELVVDLQCAIDAALIKVVERRMPPIVEGKSVVLLGPMCLPSLHEGHALGLTGLHLQDMCDGMLCPAVLRLDV